MIRVIFVGVLSILACLPCQAQDEQEKLLNRAVHFINTGQFTDALTILESLMANDSSDITLRHNRAIASFNLKNYRTALSDYLFLTRERPEEAEYFFQAGNSYEHLNDLATAIEYYNKALDIEKDNFLYFFKRGTALLKTKKFKESIPDFNDALALNPDHSNSFHNRGLARFATSNPGGACEDWCDASLLGNATASAHLAKNCKTYPPRCR